MQDQNLREQFENMKPVICKHHKKFTVTDFRLGIQNKQRDALLEPICGKCENQEEKISYDEFLKKLVESIENFRPEGGIYQQLEESLHQTKFLYDLFMKMAGLMSNNQKKIKAEMYKISKDSGKKFDKVNEIASQIFNSMNQDKLYSSLKKLIPYMDSSAKVVQLNGDSKKAVNSDLKSFNQELKVIEQQLQGFLQVSDITPVFIPKKEKKIPVEVKIPVSLEYLIQNEEQIEFSSEREFKNWNYDILLLIEAKIKQEDFQYVHPEIRFKNKDQYLNSEVVCFDVKILYDFYEDYEDELDECEFIQRKYKNAMNEIYYRCQQNW